MSCSIRDTSPRDFSIMTLYKSSFNIVRSSTENLLRSVTTRCKWRLLLMSLSLQGMVIWVVEFSREGYKLRYMYFRPKTNILKGNYCSELWIDVNFRTKIYLFLYTPLENSTTRITIMQGLPFSAITHDWINWLNNVQPKRDSK